MRFTDKPDYVYLRKLFRDLFLKEGYQYDCIFDWTKLEKKSVEIPKELATVSNTPHRSSTNRKASKSKDKTTPRMRDTKASHSSSFQKLVGFVCVCDSVCACVYMCTWFVLCIESACVCLCISWLSRTCLRARALSLSRSMRLYACLDATCRVHCALSDVLTICRIVMNIPLAIVDASHAGHTRAREQERTKERRRRRRRRRRRMHIA
jgi:hypothetical protein